MFQNKMGQVNRFWMEKSETPVYIMANLRLERL